MPEPIRYHVDLSDRVHHLVRVRLTVPGDLADGARVVLPTWTPGSYVRRDYVHHVQWIRAHDASGDELILRPDGITAWHLPTGMPPADVEVELELYANEPTVRTNHVDDHHALLIPAATFPYVDGARDRPHVVHLPPQPAEHTVHSLLPAGDDADTYVASDLDHLIDSAFEVGDLTVVDYQVAGIPHRFVWGGYGGPARPSGLADDAAVIGEAAVALFDGALPVDRYTFLCIAWDRGGGGLEHRDGAVLSMPQRVFQSEDALRRLQSLIAHEYLHLWNVKRLVPAALVRPDYEAPTPSESLWVAEGWTAYYDELLCVRAGLWTPRRYLDAVCDAWRRVEDTPGVALQPLREASRTAWVKHYVRDENSINAGTDYYAHGALVAWYLDLLLREHDPQGEGIDAVLRLLWERHAGDPAGYTEADVEAALCDTAGSDLSGVIARHVAGTELPPIADAITTVGLSVVPEEAGAIPYLGVRVSQTDAGTTITSVLRGRPAWEAGLTGGDRIVAFDGLTVGRTELTNALAGYRTGDVVEVAVTRGPRLLTLPVKLGAPRPKVRFAAVDAPTDTQRTAFERWTGQPLSAT